MTSLDLHHLVLDALNLANNARLPDQQIPIAKNTALFGENGHLDSLELVGLLLDLEESLIDHGIEVSLNDEKAMSEKNSPFRDVESLVAYIASQLS
ncbi:MAG: hypothetical protein Cons2KO_30390 [Congregibacter sp.]